MITQCQSALFEYTGEEKDEYAWIFWIILNFGLPLYYDYRMIFAHKSAGLLNKLFLISIDLKKTC
jgi:hypothetical protein